jgi:hypothetical protein
MPIYNYEVLISYSRYRGLGKDFTIAITTIDILGWLYLKLYLVVL